MLFSSFFQYKSNNKIDIGNRLLKYKVDYILVFIIIFLIDVCCRHECIEIKIYPDHFGMTASAAKLSGYNWNEVLNLSPYYGPGYYILFTPILKFIKNPIYLYNIICDIDFAMAALCGVLLHHIICDVLHYAKRWNSAIISAITTLMTFQMEIITFSNEAPSLFLMLLLIYCILKYMASGTYNVKIFYSIIFIILQLYALTVHVRNIVFAAGIAVTFIVIIFLDRRFHKSKSSYLICGMVLIAVLLGFLGYKKIPAFFSGLLFNNVSGSAMGNQEIVVPKTSSIEDMIIVLKGSLQVFLGNIIQSIKQTYGLILVSYFLIFKEIIYIIRIIIKKKNNTNKKVDSNVFIQFNIVFVFSATCFILGLLGTCVSWAGNMRGSGYWRYYGTYSTPMLALSLIYAIDNFADVPLKFKLLLMGVCSISVKLFITILIPILGTYFDFWFVYPYMQGGENTMSAFMLTFVIAAVGGIILIFANRHKIAMYIILFAVGYIIPQLKGGNLLSYVPNNICDTGYEVINELAGNNVIDKEKDLYFIGTDNGYLYYQYMMLGNGITRNIPENAENIIVFSNQGAPEGEWMTITLDDNEYANTKDMELYSKINQALEEVKRK